MANTNSLTAHPNETHATGRVASAGEIRQPNNFNLLRLSLAAMVILSHSPELIDGNRRREPLTAIFHTLSFGELAVDCFFLISGFLILQSWQSCPKLTSFIKKRVVRIYPAFIVASILSALLVGPHGSVPSAYFAQFNPLRFFIGLATLQLPAIPPVFAGQPHPYVNGSMWTISYEFRCYLLVAVFGMCGLLKRRRWWVILFFCSAVCALFPSLVNWIAFPGLHTFFGAPSQFAHFLAFFTAGGCFYRLNTVNLYSNRRAGIAGLLLLACMFNENIAAPSIMTLGAYCLFWLAFAQLPKFARLDGRCDISYGVYLYGWPIQKLLIWNHPQISPWVLFALSMTASCACGWMSWHLIEKHFLNLKKNEQRAVQTAKQLTDTP